MNVRYWLNNGAETTGPHNALETFQSWDAGKLPCALQARREDAAEHDPWLPLSALLERDGFDTSKSKRRKGERIITLAEVTADAVAEERRAAAVAMIPPCPLCGQKNWHTASEVKGGWMLTSLLAAVFVGIPMALFGLVLSWLTKSAVPLVIVGAGIILLCITGGQRRHYRQCGNCRYRYETG